MAQRPNSTSAFGAFLRARRDRLTPQQVGLTSGIGQRRIPGLRREELAALAGISNDYYIRLERGKEQHPSPAVVDSLAKALQLDDDERRHLRDLASQADRTASIARGTTVSEVPLGAQRMLDALRPLPAFITNRIGDFVAWNPSGLRLLHGLSDWPEQRRNAARYGFTHPAARELYLDWEQQVSGLVSGLRRLAAKDPDDQVAANLVGELLDASSDFERLWNRYDIEGYDTGSQRLNHPQTGELTVEYQVLQLDGLAMMVYHADSGSPQYRAFELLDS